MTFGWKVLIPVGLLWILVTGAIIALPERVRRGSRRPHGGGRTLLVLLVVAPLFVGAARGVADRLEREAEVREVGR